MTILSSDILGLWWNRLSIGRSTSGIFGANLDLQDFVAGAVFGEVGGWLDWLRALEMTFHIVTQTTDDIDFVWQVQYLVRLEGHFVWQAQYLVRSAGDCSWQAQHFVTFREIAGMRNVVFYNTTSSPKMGRVRSRKRRVRDDDFIVGYRRMWSDYRRIVFLLAEAFREFPLKSWASRFRGRRSVWWGWTVTLLPPRIGNEVAYVRQIIDDLHFAWQAQYLVRLQGAFACSAHWKWGCICDADHWWLAFCVAGAVFSWGCRVSLLAPRIGNDVWYVWITGDIHFVWQAQYLVRLQAAFACSAHWKWRFICDADDLHFARQAQYLVRLQGACPCSPHWKWRLVLSSTE